MHISFDMMMKQSTLWRNVSSIWLKGHCNITYKLSCCFDFYCLESFACQSCLYKKNISEDKQKKREVTKRIHVVTVHKFTKFCASALCSLSTALYQRLCRELPNTKTGKCKSKEEGKKGEEEKGRRGLSQLLLGSVSSDRRLWLYSQFFR